MTESAPLPDSAAPPDLASEILAGLSGEEGLPHEAMEAAVANWEAVLPAFLDRLDAYVRDPEANEADAEALFFVAHLCGQMRETRAWRPLMALYGMEPERACDVLGDAVTITAQQIAASLFDGDPAPMQAVILDAAADEFIRSALLETLAFLTGEGRIDRADTADFLRHCDDALRPRAESFVWVGWQSAIAYLGLTELADRVRAAFREDRIDPTFMDLDDFERDLTARLTGDQDRIDETWGHFGYFGDAAGTLSTWYGFSEEYREERARMAEREEDLFWPDEALEPQEPAVNPTRHVGRNDPCPCGSGRKFKKCCLGKL